MDLNDAWKSTCKTVFGQEIGELQPYEAYLKEAVMGRQVASAFSKKPLFISSGEYAPSCRFFDYETERERLEPLNAPFDLNRAKDIDSLLEQIGERMVYGANKVQGRSENVHGSDMVVDSINVHDSAIISKCKNIKCGYIVRESENVFGGASFGFGANVIRSSYSKSLSRVFECSFSDYLSDSLFCYNTFNSSDCMFTFNSRNRRHMIANIQLDGDKYHELKAGLVGQIIDELERKGRLNFSIVGLLGVG